MRKQEELGFPLLADPGSATIRAYGVLNESRGDLPHPTAVVVDTERRVRYVRVDRNYKQRPPAAELLEALDGLGPVDAAEEEPTAEEAGAAGASSKQEASSSEERTGGEGGS